MTLAAPRSRRSRPIVLGFDDDRLGGLAVDQLGFLLEEYYRVKTRDGLEVDMLARYPAADPELIQVCADPSAPEALAREVRALRAAADEHAGAIQRLLVLDRDALAVARAPGVDVRPAYEWLLAPAIDE